MEAYLVSLFEDTNLCAIHAKRVTIRKLFLARLLFTRASVNMLLQNPRISNLPVVSVASVLRCSSLGYLTTLLLWYGHLNRLGGYGTMLEHNGG